MMRCFKALCLVLATQPLASAWLTTAPTRAMPRLVSHLHSAVEETVSTCTGTMSPEFKAACRMAQDTLESQVPEKYRETMLPLLQHFVNEYMTASQAAYKAGNEVCRPDITAQRILQGIQYGLEFGILNKYQFDVSHTALRGKDPEAEDGNTVDYYSFGCDFFRPCMDLEHSVILGKDNLKRAMDQIANGENVVLLANHQSEADPQVVSVMLEEAGHAQAAADMVYVAGHKVTTDPLAIPFSMGRNMICIHSKKHITSDLDLKPLKQRQNLKAMTAMLKNFKKGGCLLWVAPSGGRDRRNVETNEVPIAPFDSKTIDMFRLYGNKSKVPTHYYTLAMVSYDLCPPPDFVEAGVGESRNVRFVPVGIAMGEEVVSEGGLELRHEFCRHAQEQCEEDYQKLAQAIEQNKQQAGL